MNDQDRKHDALQRRIVLVRRGQRREQLRLMRLAVLEHDEPLPQPGRRSGAMTRHTFPTESRTNEENRGYGPGFLLVRRYQFCFMLPLGSRSP